MSPISDVAVFVQVIERGSFTAAAERLGLSKSVVSKYVTRLEDRLGARLVNRTTRRLSLTEVGRRFYEGSQRGLQELEQAEAEVRPLQAEPRGDLKINAPMSFGILHIAPALPDFMKKYPDLAVDMRLDDRKVDIVEDGFDLAVRISELPDSSLVARRIAACRHVVCATPEYLAKNGTPRAPEDLRQHRIITYQYQESASNWHFLSARGESGSVTLSGALQMNNSLAIREAVLQHAGITRIPTFVVGTDIQAGRLQAVLSDYASLELSVYAIYAGRKYLSPKIRAFIDFLAARIADPPYWDRGV